MNCNICVTAGGRWHPLLPAEEETRVPEATETRLESCSQHWSTGDASAPGLWLVSEEYGAAAALWNWARVTDPTVPVSEPTAHLALSGQV